MSVLKELYNGRIYPAENNVPDTEEYRKATTQAEEFGERLTTEMSDRQIELFEQYMSATGIVDKLIQEEVFRQGFVMGATLRKEIEP